VNPFRSCRRIPLVRRPATPLDWV